MLRNWLIFGALTCAAGSALAENWAIVDPNPNEPRSVDLDTMVTSGAYRKLWVRIDYPNGSQDWQGGQRVGRVMVRYTVRCSDHEFSSGQMLVYDRSLKLTDSVEGTPDKFAEPPPGSFAEKMVNANCAR
ncbi:surface-adhesin E family protein [Caballeronia sp. NCTM5]|uniref:surface-adhesin E family protein n=1 Tax=Caballeronia sp. NCTM5 TaxID=2921755 RepID=UPI00202987D9|nr:surface-adhesin E family protein [Caballeronia sp. NCTM5]